MVVLELTRDGDGERESSMAVEKAAAAEDSGEGAEEDEVWNAADVASDMASIRSTGEEWATNTTTTLS